MTDNGAAPPPELIATGPARISVIERAGGGGHGQPGLRLADARGAAGARLHRRFGRLSMSALGASGTGGGPAEGGPLCWRTGTGDGAAEISGRWRPAGDGRFLLASGDSRASPGGETLDGVLRERPGSAGEWELDLVYAHAAAGRITLARVTTVCAAVTPPPGAAPSPGGRGQAVMPWPAVAGAGITVPAAYDITIRPAIDGTGYGQLPGTLAFLELLDRRKPAWPPFLLTGHDDLRPGFLSWGVTEAGDAEVTADGRALHIRLGPEHADGALPSWSMTGPGGLPVCLPYQAASGTADFAVDGESVTGTVRLAGPPGGHSYQAEITGTRHRDLRPDPAAGLTARMTSGPAGPAAGGREPERAWLDRLCAEFDLTLDCGPGFPGQPAVPALLTAFPADLGSSRFEFSLTAAGSPGQPGHISWSLSGLSTAQHVSGNKLTVTGPPGPQWYADESTLIAVADAKLELTHTAGHSVTGELTVTGTTGRVFRAAITGSWRGSAAAAVRRSLAAPDFTGSWRGVLGTDSLLAVSAAADGWWRPAGGQPGPLFLRHVPGPDLAVGLTGDGSLVALERAEPAVTGEASVSDGAALRTVGQRLMHQQRYAEAMRLLGRAAACFAGQADAAERTGHDLAARNYLVSATASAAEGAFCALALSDYPALLRCLAEDIGWRRRLIGLVPALSGVVLAGARQLPGSLENWRRRLDEDADRIDSASAGTPFYGLLALFMLDHGAVEDALVAAELGRARAFADLVAGADGERADDAAPRFSRAVLRETVAGQHTAVEYFVTDHGLLIFVIDAAGEVRAVPAACDAVPRLTAGTERYRQVMTAGRLDEAALDAVLRELYDVLWQPVAAQLPAAPDETVLIVPHGAAMQVPFPGLRAADGQYLIQRHGIALLPGLALLPMLGQRAAARATAPAGPGELLAFVSPEPLPANPDTGAPLPALDGMAELFGAIARGYPRATVRAGRAASAAALLAGPAPAPRAQPVVLYFGTRAFVSQRQTADPLDSFIALAPATGAGAGAGAGADGMLRVRDILGARLPGDIAVLAACTTGQGKVTGDGVTGLSRAFLTAGPTSLVLPLSEVDHDSSLELLAGFHARLRSGLRSSAKALARAQRQLISDGEQAHSWSSFVLFGLP
jgi:CHAT domain-containing protein